MMKKRSVLIFIALCLSHLASLGQRLADHNTLGWLGSFNTIHISKQTSVWLEYQWRRDNVITHWQQSLARAGVQYHFKNGVSVMAGYGYIISFPYGDFPAGPHHVPEHRIFEQLSWNGNVGRVLINHRTRLEQRFVGKIDQKATEREVSDWNYLNRVRYQIRPTVPLNHKTMQDKTWYAAAYDELMIGFGKNVNQNIFDQNRLGVLAGYQFNKTFRAEAGVFNQIVQQGAPVAGQQVYQYNNGLLVNFYINR